MASDCELLWKGQLKEALLYEPFSRGDVKCETCERRCVIERGKTGFCRARLNIEGRLYALTYGDISHISENPIEKKPFFHFSPGSIALTVGSYGCNFTCPWCQNWDISKARPDPSKANYISPERLVGMAKKSGCRGTSFSFNEPTTSLFEYSLDVMGIAKQSGLYNTYVTNLYSTPEALSAIIGSGCDAFCVNVKGNAEAVSKYCGANVELVWRNLREVKRRGRHVEIVTLVIPQVNGDENTLRSIATRIKDELGSTVPWHCTRYYSAYRASEFGLPEQTPVNMLERAREIGLEVGLKYVYVGNIPGHVGENTYCPVCKRLLIERVGLNTKYHDIDRTDNHCSNCHHRIDISGKCS
ncbi:MAG: AmmeMemoRadiSam system radical SAM enzyme [Promethearchaeati archaeon SRVP18_Atabeyarchaeia-1]